MYKMDCCFVVILVITLSLSHGIHGQAVITVDGKDGDDTLCQDVKEDVRHSCKTLDVALRVVKAIVTVKILNGTYHHNSALSSTLNYSDITITGDGADATIIECNNDTGFGFINASNIHISELTLSGCGELRTSTTLNAAFNATIPFRAALYFLNIINVVIDNVAVVNSNGMGVAMYDITGNVIVNNSMFRNNSVSSHELHMYPGGGGFSVEFTYCEPGVVKLLNTNECETSTNNNSVYLFYNCTFQSNIATTVDKSNTTYVTNAYGFSNQQFGRGGGLSVFFKGKAFNNTVTIDTCKFTDNHAVWGGGFHSDILDHSKDNTLNIINSTFDYNKCPFDDANENDLLSVNTGGGAIRIALLFFDTRASVLNNSITIRQCEFSRNSAYYGGAVSYKITKEGDRTVANNTVNFMECMWYKNKARTGSAVNLEAQPFPVGVTPYATFSDCFFLNNTNHYIKSSDKPVGIGALYSDNIPVVFSGNCSFSHNKGTALTGSATFFILAKNSVTKFDENVGNNGGAIALLGNTYIILDQNTKVWFTGNKAYSKGGAIYFVSSSERDFVSTQKCFIFYSDRNVDQGQWNASVYFQNNADLFNKSIYATTLLPCVWGNLPRSVKIESTSLDLLFIQTFHFVNSSRSTIGNNAMTDAINITVNEHNPVEIPPGRLYQFNIISRDELGNIVEPVFLVQTSHPNVLVDSTTVYVYDNHIRLYGQPGSKLKLRLQAVSGRPWSFTINITLSKCPPAFYYHNASEIKDRKCICTTDGYYGIYQCDSIKLLAYLYPYFWAGIIRNKDKLTFVTADCPEGYCNISIPSPPLPADLSVEASAEFELKECIYRNGTLCGKCITGYCVATNSPTYECINSTSSSLNKYGILWLIILKYIPFTIFLLLIVFFNVSLVDGPLNSYILFTQIINSVGPIPNELDIHLTKLHETKKAKFASNIYYFLYGPWNSNYFEMLVPDFCAYKFDSTIKVLMFEYIPALYPLVLFVLFYSIIPCITNCLINSERDMPRRCLLRVERMFIIFRRTWSIRNSIIHGLATFLVLSYAKVTTVTGLLLSSTTLYGHRDSEDAIKTVVRLDGTMDNFGREHLPYACVSLILFFTIIVLPPLLLLSYPLLPNLIYELNLQDKWIFRILIIKPLDKCVPFFDAFQSCFKNKYRFFAGLYFLYRAMAVVLITYDWQLTTRLIYQQGFFLLIIIIHCACQPYKSRKYNILDGCIFVILAAINSLSLYNVFNDEIYLRSSPASFWIQLILIYTPFMYFMLFFFYYVSNRCAPCTNKAKQMFCHCLSKCGIQAFAPTNNDEMPARLLDTSSSSGSDSSSSSEEEDDPENELNYNVEMRLPVENNDQSHSSVNHSPYLLGFQNRRNRFTT